MTRTTAALALAAALVVSGCGKSSDKAKADVPLENAAEACAAIQAFVDGAIVRCGLLPGYWPTSALTASVYAADPQYDCTAWSAAVANGTTAYDRAKALTCNDALNALTCAQIEWQISQGLPLGPYECAEAMRGTLAGGASCLHGFECATGICDLPTACDGAGTCASAAAAPGLDQPCAGASPWCADGLVCDTTVTPAPLCKRPPPPRPVVASGSCVDALCVDTSYCSASDLCVVRPTDGMACSGSNPCAPNTRCNAGTCQAVVQPGGACAFGDNDCATGAACVAMATVSAGTKCENWPRAGGTCGPVVAIIGTLKAEWVDCLDSWCDGGSVSPVAQGSCKPFLAVGATCDPAAGSLFNPLVGPCGPVTGYACNSTTLKCERLTCSGL